MRPEEACGGEATRAVGALAVSIGNPYVPGSSVLCCAVLCWSFFRSLSTVSRDRELASCCQSGRRQG
jgi:hypothetical protein